jgi:hypothetical protein
MPSKAAQRAELDTITDLNIVDGTVGQVLTTDGAESFSFQDTSSPGEYDFIATGAISSGDIVGLRSDGTVEVVTGATTTYTNSAGTPAVFESAETTYISAIFDSNTNKIVIAYKDAGNSSYGTARVGTVSGTSISFGTPVVFESAFSEWISATFDSNSNKVVIAYKGTTNYGRAIVGNVSGTSISFGSSEAFWTSTPEYISTTFDSNSNKVVIAYKGNSNYGTARVGTVSGTSISFGSSPVVFRSANTQFISATFDTNTNKVVIAYQDTNTTDYGSAVVGTVSGTSISFGTPVVFESGSTSEISTIFDSNTNKVVIVYQDVGNSYYGTALVFQAEGTGITTNADSWIGIAAENISDTASGTINMKSGISSNQTGLTPGTSYFVNYDGTLTATENAGPLTGTYGKIGRALSSTKLLITRSN